MKTHLRLISRFPSKVLYMIFILTTFFSASILGCEDNDETLDSLTSSEAVPRIVGGSDAEPTPYFAMHLRYDDQSKSWNWAGCGGSLITRCHVLTAAHCVADHRMGLPDGIYINAYQPYAGNPGIPFHFTTPSQIKIHEDFDNGPNIHDIAVMTLDKCAPGSFEPVAIAAPDHVLQDGHILEAYGFGRSSEDNSDIVDTLQEVSVPFIDHQECEQRYTSLTSDMLCAGYDEGGKDSCQGDSGGPLVDNSHPSPVQVGVVSWGEGCARPGSPGVYSSVSAHYDWIKKIVCADKRVNHPSLCGIPDHGNQTPIADATAAEAMAIEGTTVTLDGTGSYDPDGDNLSFRWRQTAGPQADLRDESVPNPTFTAPEVTSNTSLIFELVVNDGFSESDPVEVSVAVINLRKEIPTEFRCTHISLANSMGGAGGALRCR